MHRPVRRATRSAMHVLRGTTPAHADLRSRALAVIALTLAVDAAGSMLMWSFEQDKGEIGSFGDAVFWCTTQLLTISSQFPNPLTTGGKIVDVLLQIWAMVVVSTLAGAFGAFFVHRARDRREAADA
jgi:hypothetical protein